MLKDKQALILLNDNLNQYFTKEIDEHLAKDSVLELQKREPKFKEFAGAHAKLEYLASITSKTLWRFFRNSIPWVHLALIFELE